MADLMDSDNILDSSCSDSSESDFMLASADADRLEDSNLAHEIMESLQLESSSEHSLDRSAEGTSIEERFCSSNNRESSQHHLAAIGGVPDEGGIAASNVNGSDQSSSCQDADMLDDIQAFYQAVVDGDMAIIEKLVQSKSVNINQIFTGANIQPWHRDGGAIHGIVRKGKVSKLKELIKLGASVDLRNRTGDTALHIACKHGLVGCVQYMLENCSGLKNSQNKQGLTPLVKAVFRFEPAFRENYLKCIEFLVEYGCNVNLCPSSGITPLHIASGKGDERLIRMLIRGGANVNAICSKGFSPLLTALCRTRVHSKSVKLLLDASADINVCTVAGRTALHLAVSKSDDIAVEYLLEAGADPNCQDNYHKTPLWIAVHENNVKIVPLLIRYGGDVNYSIPPAKSSLLTVAIERHSDRMVELLVNLGASVNAESAFGATPLFSAVQEQNINIVKHLLRENCCLDQESNARHMLFPQTPLQLAFELGELEIIKLLMRVGCRVKESWLKQQNLPLSLTSQPNMLNWILDFQHQPKSMMHLSRLVVRRTMSAGLHAQLTVLIHQHWIPARLADYILMYDILGRKR